MNLNHPPNSIINFLKVPTGCTTITEFQPASDTILTVRAVDADDPRTPNGQVLLMSFSGFCFTNI